MNKGQKRQNSMLVNDAPVGDMGIIDYVRVIELLVPRLKAATSKPAKHHSLKRLYNIPLMVLN